MGGEVTCWGVQEHIYGRHYDSSQPDVQKEKETDDYFRRLSYRSTKRSSGSGQAWCTNGFEGKKGQCREGKTLLRD